MTRCLAYRVYRGNADVGADLRCKRSARPNELTCDVHARNTPQGILDAHLARLARNASELPPP